MRPSDVVGVPVLPPPAATAGASAAIRAVHRLARGMTPPPVAILEGVFGALDHRALVVLCEADVPDLLHRATSVADLARRTGADPDRLERVLRYAATRGWVRFDRRGRVTPTRSLRFLRRDHPGGWRAWVEFAGGPEVTGAIGALDVAPGDHDRFHEVNGAPFFAWMAEHPDRWDAFDRAMAAGGRMHGLALAAALDWSTGSTVCDVGGGTGQLLATLLDLVPHLTGTVFDLPDVVARATTHPRLSTVGGDAFESVPTGFDTYLLVNVVHDWGDDDAAAILGSVARAAPPGARIVVVDADHRRRPVDRVATGADLLMAALTGGGRERDRAALAALVGRAGLRLVTTTRLASGDLAHEVRLPTS